MPVCAGTYLNILHLVIIFYEPLLYSFGGILRLIDKNVNLKSPFLSLNLLKDIV